MAASIHPDQEPERPSKSVAVVGAGVSGLAAAYRLKSKGVAVTVFEADESTGGKIKTVLQDGLIWEKGPNTMTESEVGVTQLIDELGIREQQEFPCMQRRIYTVKNGEPQLVPSNPLSIFSAKFLSARAKFNFFMEPILWKRKKPKDDRFDFSNTHEESVGDFARRHFDQEIVDYMVDPFIAGTTGADTESLSLRHAFPDALNLEERCGSIIIGLIKVQWSRIMAQKGKKRRGGSFSFTGGLQTLTNALSTKLGEESLKLDSSVLSLSYNLHGNTPHSNWLINYERNGSLHKQPIKEQSFDAVIMTAPLCNFHEMQITKEGKPFLLDFLPKVKYLPMSVIITTFKEQDVKRPLKGFGILIPSKEEKNGLRTLGTFFSSSMFPERAPKGQCLFTTFIGGSRDENLAKSSLKELQAVAMKDLNKLLGIENCPLSVNHVYWSKAFPLYSLDYDSVVDAINKIEKSLPGFYIAGTQKNGLSVGKAIRSGLNAADLVIKHFEGGGRDL